MCEVPPRSPAAQEERYIKEVWGWRCYQGWVSGLHSKPVEGDRLFSWQLRLQWDRWQWAWQRSFLQPAGRWDIYSCQGSSGRHRHARLNQKTQFSSRRDLVGRHSISLVNRSPNFKSLAAEILGNKVPFICSEQYGRYSGFYLWLWLLFGVFK